MIWGITQSHDVTGRVLPFIHPPLGETDDLCDRVTLRWDGDRCHRPVVAPGEVYQVRCV